jgi:hypothetical protein
MNKKGIALALVLVIAMSGAFAAPLEINGSPVESVSATLTAIIGDYFVHGFDDPALGTQFNAELEIDNAFVEDPNFTYRYETNTQTAFEIKMAVSDFINDANSDVRIKIADVLVGVNDPDPDGNLYTILTSSLSVQSGHADITIKPMKNITTTTLDHLGTEVTTEEVEKYVNDNATPGSYTSTVTISVATTS